MVQAVIGGVEEFNALAYGQVHQGTVQFMEQRIMNQFSALGNVVSDYAREFFERAQRTYQEFNGSEAMRRARAAVRKAGAYFQRDEIRPLNSLDDFRIAPNAMLPFLMAEPITRKLYQEQRIDGYSNRYVDYNPGDIGRDHVDYRRVTEAVLMPDEENDFKITYYFDEMREGESELPHDNKADVLNAWEAMNAYRQVLKEDATDEYGGKL